MSLSTEDLIFGGIFGGRILNDEANRRNAQAMYSSRVSAYIAQGFPHERAVQMANHSLAAEQAAVRHGVPWGWILIGALIAFVHVMSLPSLAAMVPTLIVYAAVVSGILVLTAVHHHRKAHRRLA